MIHRAVILSAGVGSRLGRLTDELPKPLIPVGAKPPLQRHLEACAAAGVTEVYLNTHHLAEKIRAFVGDGSRFGVRAEYSFEPVLMGTAGALHAFRSQLENEPFFVLYGDNILSCDLRELGRVHSASGAEATVALHHREDVSTSGMVVTDATGRITRFVEKPPRHEQVSNLVNAGIYALDPAIFGLIPPGESDFGRDIFPRMLAEGRPLMSFLLAGEVLPIDTPELLEAARRKG